MGAHNREMAHSIRSRVGLLAAALVTSPRRVAANRPHLRRRGRGRPTLSRRAVSGRPTSSFNLSSPTLPSARQNSRDMRQRVLSCLTDKGVTGASFGPSGQLSVPDQPVGSSISEEQQEEFVHTCSIDAGQPIIEALEFNMRVNPDHRDFNELYTQCLIRNKAVEPSFTAQELARARESGTPLASALPFIDPAQGPDILQRCLEDPST